MKRIHFSLFLSFFLGLGLLWGCDESVSSSASPASAAAVSPEVALKEKLNALDKACFYLGSLQNVRIQEDREAQKKFALSEKHRELQKKIEADREAMDKIDIRTVANIRFDILRDCADMVKVPLTFNREVFVAFCLAREAHRDDDAATRAVREQMEAWEKALDLRYGEDRARDLERACHDFVELQTEYPYKSSEIEMRRLEMPKTMAVVDKLMDKIEARFRLAAKHDAVIRQEMDRRWKYIKTAPLIGCTDVLASWLTLLQTADRETNGQEFELLKKMAEAGDAEAQCLLGMQYEGRPGWLIPMDAVRDRKYYTAVAWFRKAADKGNAEALARLSRAYYNGDGVEESRSKAKQCASMAGEQGHFLALGMLINWADSDYEKENYLRQMLKTDEAWLVPALFPRQYEKYNRSGLEK